MKIVYLDTGPLVALFRKRDQFHQWVKTVLSQDKFRFITCAPVLTETLFITKNSPLVAESLSSMIDNDLLELKSALSLYKDEVFHLLQKYHDQKTSLADICLLTLYNHEEGTSVFTTDSDFFIYRDSKGKPLNLISPYKS
ncbi:MAG: PIN domain-containing protein [Balneolaceae bacterium]